MVLPIGALLSAGVSGIGIAAQMGAQADQRNLSLLNYYEQKRQAMEREKLAKATRSDLYGNKVVYNPGTGFETIATPLTRAILNSQQKEQLAQFRDDAPRARAAAERIDRRAKAAGDVYEEKFNKYRYGRQKSEAEYVAEAIRNAVTARRENTSKNAVELLSRAALRTGNSSALPYIVKSAKGLTDEETLSQAIAKAKAQGKQQYLAEKSASDSTTFGELNNLRSIADAIVSPQLNWQNENAAVSGRADNALSGLIQTNAQNSNAVGNALSRAAAASGQSPDFSALAGALGRFNLPEGSGKSEEEQYLADLIVKRQIGDNLLGIYGNNNKLSAYKGNVGVF